MNANVEQAVKDFANALRLKAFSAYTVSHYCYEVRWLAAAYPERGVWEFTPAEVEAYAAARRARVADASYKATVFALQSFFAWAVGKKKSPARKLKPPKRVTPVRHGGSLNKQQGQQLLTSFDTSTAAGVRDVGLVMLGMDAALRSFELALAQESGVDLERRTITVRVKGGKVDRRKFSEDTRGLLAMWMGYRRVLARPEATALFVSLSGTRPGSALTPGGVGKLCRRALAAAGLPVAGMGTHFMRRTFAHEVLRAHASTRIAQAGGGWESLEVFETHYTRDLELDDIDPFLPTRRMLGGAAESR